MCLLGGAKVLNIIESRLKTEKRKEDALNFAVSIQAKIDQDMPFKRIVNEDDQGIVRLDSTEQFSMVSSPRGLGLDHIFNATAFSLNIGQVSKKVETNRGIYWQQLLEKTPFDSSQYMIQKEMIRQRLLSRKKSQVFTTWYEYLKENADIEDNRKFFNL